MGEHDAGRLAFTLHEGDRILLSTADGPVEVFLERIEGSRRTRIAVTAPPAVRITRAKKPNGSDPG